MYPNLVLHTHQTISIAAFDMIKKNPENCGVHNSRGGAGGRVSRSTLIHVAITKNCTVFIRIYKMLLKIFLQCMSTNLTFLIPQMRRQSRCCQVSTFVPLAFWLTRTMLSFRDPLHYACWRLVNDVSMSYHMFITLEKLCFIYEKYSCFLEAEKCPRYLLHLAVGVLYLH